MAFVPISLVPTRSRTALAFSSRCGSRPQPVHSSRQPVMATRGEFSLGGAAMGASGIGARFAFGTSLNCVVFIGALVVRQRMLTREGLWHALVLGILLFGLAGPGAYALCFGFLIVGSAATRIGRKAKEAAGIAEARGGARGPENLWGAAGAATICAVVSALTADPLLAHSALVAYVAAIATKMSDTVSSEIGKAYGSDTWLLTTLRKVPRGTEGGVSLEGTAAGVLGSALAAWFGASVGLLGGSRVLFSVGVIVVAAFVANVVESVIGSTVQKRWAWSNEFVNFVNTSVGALVAFAATIVSAAL